MAFGPQSSVVVMHEGHLLIRLAAELAQVMGRRRAGDQRQVHGRAGGMEPPGDGHRHVVHSRDVLQSLELRDFRVQAHHLVDIFPVPVLQESSVFLGIFGLPVLLLGEEGKILQGFKGKRFSLLVEEEPQDVQVIKGAGAVLAVFLRELFLRIQNVAGVLVGEGQPALLRLTAQKEHGGAADLKQPSAGETFYDGEQRRDLHFPVLPVQYHLHRLLLETGS